MQNLSIITYAARRFDQVKIVIPHLLSIMDYNDELIFVDYSCPDHCGRWVRSLGDPRVAVVKVYGMNWFHHPHAINIGATFATKPILIVHDIDIMESKDLLSRIREMKHGEWIHTGCASNISGYCAVWKEDFFHVGGYEEALVGHPYHDTAFYSSLDASGVKCVPVLNMPQAQLQPGTDQFRHHEKNGGDTWTQNQDIVKILRQRHPYKNNVSRNWGIGGVVI